MSIRKILGTHYRPATWASAIRHPGGSQLLQGDITDADIDVIREAVEAGNTVVLNAGGLGSGRNADHVADFLTTAATSPSVWRDEITARARRVHEALREHAPQIVWQLGNEVNANMAIRNRLAWRESIRYPATDPYGVTEYVELFARPAIAALADVSLEIHGNRERINISMGSIAAAGSPGAVAFNDRVRDALGNYLECGETIHYLATSSVPDFIDTLHTYGSPRRCGLLATEELGIQKAAAGYGGAATVRTIGRYMEAYADGVLPPGFRLFLYGAASGPQGATGDEAAQFMVDKFGDGPVRQARAGQWLTVDGDNLDVRAFSVGRRVGVVLSAVDQGLAAAVDLFSTGPLDYSTVDYTLFDWNGVTAQDGVPHLIGGGSTLLVTIDRGA